MPSRGQINDKLRSLANEWSAQYGGNKPLTYEGLPLWEVLKKQEDDDKAAELEERRQKEVERAAREAEKAAAKAGPAAKGGPAKNLPRPSKSAPK